MQTRPLAASDSEALTCSSTLQDRRQFGALDAPRGDCREILLDLVELLLATLSTTSTVYRRGELAGAENGTHAVLVTRLVLVGKAFGRGLSLE